MAEIKRTPQQQLAVDSEGGALLVSAAAGSGKTKVLVDRVLRHICDPKDPKDINSFLIITYTKAAAAELRGKLAAAIGAALAQQPENRHLQRQLSRIYLAQISTVHSFCATILRDYAHELGLYPEFRVVEEQEAAIWQQQAMEEAMAWAYSATQPDCMAFLDHLGAGRDDRAAAAILMDAYRSVGCHPDPEGWIAQCLQSLQLDDCTDIADTPWGKLLMADFMETLDEQIAAMERGLARLAAYPAAEEKYAPTFRENLEQLRQLRAASTWDEVRARRIVSFGSLKAVRGGDAEALERLKRPRKLCMDWLKKAQGAFSLSSAEGLAELRQGAPVIRGMFRLLREFTDRYQAIKQRRRALDFGDLEHEALRLLRYPGSGTPTPVARELSRRYCEIMVDEYQDSNAVQDSIFAAISKDGTNIFMVGDVKQSIYRFRLADPGIFLQKYRSFVDAKAAGMGQPRRVVLSQNFRSRREILSAVNDIFALTMTERVGDLRYGAEEALYPGAELPPIAGARVELHCLDTSDKEDDTSKRVLEARLVAQRVAKLLREATPVTDGGALRPVAPSDVVILLRSLHSQAQDYLDALQAQGIAACCDQRDDILATTEVAVLLSYLQILDNPHQDIPLLSVLLSPVFGYSAQQVAQVRENRCSGDFYTLLLADAQEHETFAPFLRQLAAMRRLARQEPVDVVVRTVWEETRLRDVFCAMPDGAQRMENLQAIYLMAAAFDPEGSGSLHDFLLKIEQQRVRGISGAGAHSANAVRLMSIHKAKGLEFPVVIVAGLSTKFNTADERQAVQIHSDLGTGCDVVDLEQRIKYPSLAKQAVLAKLRQERLSEELRVLYVALTRPKDLLIMTYASSHLRNALQGIAAEVSADGPVSLSRSASCLGHWVLMAAMRRAEAGALFEIGGRPEEIERKEAPWHIQVWTPEALPKETARAAEVAVQAHAPDSAELAAAVSFRYPHLAATTAPAKLTATQLKGRFLDTESADGAPERQTKQTVLRQPLFLQGQRPLSASEQGTAVHLAMQYIRYACCCAEATVVQELRRLVDEGFLLEAQAACVPPAKITALFRSELGKRILSAENVVREFKFSLLMEGEAYALALAGEKIMLQGVVDCCLLEPDGLCVIDFKTDRVAPGQEAVRAEHYRGQLEAYSLALSRIFGKQVKEKHLYFFATDTAVKLL